MEASEAYRITGVKNVSLHFQRWRVPDRPRAVLLLAHGYAEHCGVYDHVADVLNSRGLDLVGYDFRGHGKSDGIRAYTEKFDDFIEDHLIMIDKVKELYPETPLYLLAHSTGCMISLFSAARRPDGIHGVILSGAALMVDMPSSPLINTGAAVLSALFPKMKIVKPIYNILTRNPDYLHRFKTDPLIYNDKTRARIGIFFIRMREKAERELPGFSLPILLMHGTKDELIKPESSAIISGMISSRDKELKWWDGLAHVLFQEPERDQVISYMLEWLEKRLG